MLELNKFYYNIKNEQFTKWGIKNIENIKLKINDYPNKLYLGIFENNWLYTLINCPNGDFINYNKHNIVVQRQKIPKKVRNEVWQSHNGDLIYGTCYCCSENISFNNFECGHIIPHSKGGSSNKENLKPICSSCNKDMGTRHLEEYKNSITNSN